MIVELYSATIDCITKENENKTGGKHIDHNYSSQASADCCSKYLWEVNESLWANERNGNDHQT